MQEENLIMFVVFVEIERIPVSVRSLGRLRQLDLSSNPLQRFVNLILLQGLVPIFNLCPEFFLGRRSNIKLGCVLYERHSA